MAGMISFLQPLPVGNAVQITVAPLPSGTVQWRLLRNVTGVFPAYNDPASTLVTDSNAGDPLQVIDAGAGLVNGTLTYYQLFYFNGSAWAVDPSPPDSCTPATIYEDDSVDAQTIVADRVRLGIAAEITRGALNPLNGSIDVLLAPPVFSEETRWPVVSVHLNSEAPIDRGLGELMAHDFLETETNLWDDHEGWHSKTQLSVIGWSLNPDERRILRMALRRIIIANLPVFDAELLLQIEFSQQDVEDFTTYPAPVYETIGTFTCVTPLSVNAPSAPITDVEVTVTPIN